MKPSYRIEYMDHQPGCYGSAYADCWNPPIPNRAYTRIETALRLMREHAAASTAPAYRRGVTRVIEFDADGAFAGVIASVNHDRALNEDEAAKVCPVFRSLTGS